MPDQEPNSPQTVAEGNAAGEVPRQTGSEGNSASQVQAELMPGIEERLRQAEQKSQEHHESWLRAKAETENLRKRAQADIASAHKYAVENLAEALLPIRDSLETALAIENATLDSLKAGVELTLRQLNAVFEKASLREINPANEKFDPHRHQAMTMVPHAGAPNQVVSVMQKGYLLHDRVIRPALVTVSKAIDA